MRGGKKEKMLRLPRACACGLKIHKQARRLSCRCVQISLPLEPGNTHTQGHKLSPQGSFQLNQPCFCLPAAAAGAAVSLESCPAEQEAELPGTSSVGVGAARPWSRCACDTQTPCAPLWSVFSYKGHRSWFSLWDGGRGTLKELPSSESSACAALTLHISRHGKRDHKRVLKKITKRMGSGNCFCPSSGNKFDCCCEEPALQKADCS